MTSTDKVKDASAALADDVAQLRKDFKTLRDDISSLASAGAKETKSQLKDGLSKAEHQAEATMDAATSELLEIQKQTEKAIRKNPISTVGAALAIGYFVGNMLSRR
ncbi:hypothetical protein PUV54_05710 [Hyphococcus flavus]|uniref:DUF883 domain-containing protein n=1 Tax=Hyphococcus flavus TaxID=1866326 RepID=A0AAE9ZHJ1_9PROT|nr:hypothetical protein [Hyphococcus flavus]WDI32692.1 hypothetical protein PUV54_05710 [Hyphococcus flavus]